MSYSVDSNRFPGHADDAGLRPIESFANFNVGKNHLEILFNCSGSGVGPEILHF